MLTKKFAYNQSGLKSGLYNPKISHNQTCVNPSFITINLHKQSPGFTQKIPHNQAHLKSLCCSKNFTQQKLFNLSILIKNSNQTLDINKKFSHNQTIGFSLKIRQPGSFFFKKEHTIIVV
jgi:hypothetical protein